MQIERLSPEDELMLWPDQVWPQDIGALVLLEGDRLLDAGGALRIDAVRAAVAARLHLVPRFRQLLSVPPRELGGPLWIDAPGFDIKEHVRVRPAPPPGDESALLEAVEELRRQRLDRSRPLWEMWFVTGLPERRVALFVRMHHCIADGMAGVATMVNFLEPAPDAVMPPAVPWTPAPSPTDADLLADLRSQALRRRRARLDTATHPVRAVRQLVAVWPALKELVAQRPPAATSLDRRVGAGRRLALARARLDVVKEIAHRHGATVNDVLLAVSTGAFQRLLASRGESGTGELRMYVPVSLHDRAAPARGNLISQMVVPLPIGVADPAARLREISVATARAKSRARPSLGKLPRRSGLVGGIFLKLLGRQRVNVASADIPGPEVPLYFAGARLLEVFPMVQLIGNVSIAIGAMSYAGQFNVMVVADRDAYPDLDVFIRGLDADMAALATAGFERPAKAPRLAGPPSLTATA